MMKMMLYGWGKTGRVMSFEHNLWHKGRAGIEND